MRWPCQGGVAWVLPPVVPAVRVPHGLSVVVVSLNLEMR